MKSENPPLCRQCSKKQVDEDGALCRECVTGLAAAFAPAAKSDIIFQATSGARYIAVSGADLGEGTFGKVIRARQEGSGVPVALKMLKPFPGDGREDEQKWRFAREMDALLALDHPGLVRLHARGMDDGGHPWLAMDFVEGPRLSDWIKQRQPSRRERLEVFARICDAIQYAHEQGVLHRDLKPGNILVEEATGAPRVIDFGLARFIEEDAGHPLTLEGQALGTPMFMAPELLDGAKFAASTRSDVYALGVVLYGLLADAMPYEPGMGHLELIAAIRSREPRSIAEIAPALPRDLAAIVRKAMARIPAERYSGAGALAEDTRRYLAGLPVEACRTSLLYTTTKFARRHWRQLSAAALILLSLTGAGLWHLHRMSERTAVASAAYREARNQMAWTVNQGAAILHESGRSDGIAALLGPAESFPWDLPVDDGGRAIPAWEAALIKAKIQYLNGDIRLEQSDPVAATARFAAAEALARTAADDPAASPASLGCWFEYRAARLKAQAIAGNGKAEEILAWLEECRSFPAERWQDAESARPQAASALMAAAMPLLRGHDPVEATRWHGEVSGWLATRLQSHPREVFTLLSSAQLATAAAHLAAAEDGPRAWERAAAVWQAGSKIWPRHADFGQGEAACHNEAARLWTARGDLPSALAAWLRADSILKARRDNFVFSKGPAAEESLIRSAVPLATALHSKGRHADALTVCRGIPELLKSVSHNISPDRLTPEKQIPDLWPVLAEGLLTQGRAARDSGGSSPETFEAFDCLGGSSRYLAETARLLPHEKARWVLQRCQVMLEWAAVPSPPGVRETPEAILTRAASLPGETGPMEADQQKEAARLEALIADARAAIPEKK